MSIAYETSSHAETGVREQIPAGITSMPVRVAHPNYAPDVASRLVEYAQHPAIDVAVGTDAYEKLCEREWRFYDKVYSAAQYMAAQNPGQPVTLMFDVDNTICEGYGDQRVIRPAFPLVVAALAEELGPRLRVGLLTTLHNRDNTLADLCFADVKKELWKPENIISTSTYVAERPVLNQRINGQTEAAQVEGLADIVDPRIVVLTRLHPEQVRYWRDPDGKLEILQQLLATTDGSYVFIDNMPSAGIIRKDHPRLRGVHVGAEMQNKDWPRFPNTWIGHILRASDNLY
jgi:hypothetical protein